LERRGNVSTTFRTEAIEAWNIMSGTIDFSALPVVGEYLGVENYEQFIADLVCIQEHMKREKTNG